MAFSGFIKDTSKKAVEDTFAKIQQSIFPNGEPDIARDVARVSKITRGKIPANKIRGFVTGCKCLVFIGKTHDEKSFVASFQIRSENLISVVEAWDVYAYFEGEAAYLDSWALFYKTKGVAITDEIRQAMADISEKFSKGTYNDFIEGGFGEFGLTKTNPIPTLSIKSSNRYLSRLRYDGRPVQYKRLGSTQAEVTPGNIDIYQTSIDGNEVGAVYICPYHKRNSRLSPKGFTIV